MDGELLHNEVAAGLGISMQLEVCEEGRVLGKALLTSRSALDAASPKERIRSWGAPVEWIGTAPNPDVDLSRWELRVRGVPDGVLTIWEATRWWNGEFVEPLSATLARGPSR